MFVRIDMKHSYFSNYVFHNLFAILLFVVCQKFIHAGWCVRRWSLLQDRLSVKFQDVKLSSIFYYLMLSSGIGH